MLEELFELELRVLGENVELLDDLSLSNLRKYKYSSVDLSPTSKYLLNPYVWTPVSELLPRWLAPNVVTLIGISAVVLSLLLVQIYIPDFEAEAPRWVYFYFAASLFFYQTMDNVDGKQARRTNSSSPLGELFDHGIDSLNCVWGGLLTSAGMGLGSTWITALTMFSTCVPMYFSTWETYYTHTLFLGFLNGPTEGLLVTVAALIASGLLGPEIWNTEVAVFGGMSLKTLWAVVVALATTVGHIPGCLYNVKNALENQSTYSVADATAKLRPILLLVTSILVWLSSPGSHIITDNHLFMFGIGCSFAFGRITTAIILSHLCWQPFPMRSLPMMLVYLGTILYGVLPRLGLGINGTLSEYKFVALFTGFSTIYFLLYAKLVIDKLTHYLGITAFTVSNRL